MRHYTITRNGEIIGGAYQGDRTSAATQYAKQIAGAPTRNVTVDKLPDGTYQPGIWHPKLRQFEPIAEPFMVEA